jgi:hypothetical protein
VRHKFNATVLIGVFTFAGLALAALLLGQGARHYFPKSYAAINRILTGIELICVVIVVLGLFYSMR